MKFALFAAFGILACGLLPANGQAQERWEDVLAAAKREGQVLVHGGPGASYEQALTQGFRKKYPDIKVTFVGLSGRDAIPKIVRERQAGEYHWDVYVGGTPSILQGLKPIGAFVSLKPALILPEVLDDKAWRGGLFSAWMDAEKTYTLGFEETVSPLSVINWDFVKKDDLKSFQDLMKPQFADKIVWDDPRLPGQGVNTAQVFLLNFGPEFLAELVSKQKITYSTIPRQGAEWVVTGRYPIGLAVATEEIARFQTQGLGKNISIFEGGVKIQSAGPGFGTVSMMDHAPDPNAAKVYINWLLSKDGQSDWVKATGHNSRRLDVAPGDQTTYPVAGKTYQDTQTEEQIPVRERAAQIAKANIK